MLQRLQHESFFVKCFVTHTANGGTSFRRSLPAMPCDRPTQTDLTGHHATRCHRRIGHSTRAARLQRAREVRPSGQLVVISATRRRQRRARSVEASRANPGIHSHGSRTAVKQWQHASSSTHSLAGPSGHVHAHRADTGARAPRHSSRAMAARARHYIAAQHPNL